MNKDDYFIVTVMGVYTERFTVSVERNPNKLQDLTANPQGSIRLE